jgi:hypothetical protein
MFHLSVQSFACRELLVSKIHLRRSEELAKEQIVEELTEELVRIPDDA